MFYVGQALHILLSLGWPSVLSDVTLEQWLETPVCALHATPNWDLASCYSSWLKLRITCTLICTVFSIDSDILKNLQTNIAKNFCSPKKLRTSIAAGSKQCNQAFLNEIAALKHQRPVPKNNLLSILNPCIDEDLFIFEEDFVESSRRNPIVLCAHPLLVFIFQHYHLRMLPVPN